MANNKRAAWSGQLTRSPAKLNEVQFCVARRTRALGNGLSKRGLQTIQVALEALTAYVIYNDS